METGAKVEVEAPLSTAIINKLINLGGLKRKLMCFKCKKMTTQVQVSYGEDVRSTFGNILSRINDYNPFMPLTAGNPFACTVCGKVRWDGGILSGVLNRRKFGASAS